LSLIPHSIAKAVDKKKNITDGFTDGNCSPKKNFPLEHYRRIYSIGDSGIYSKYFLAISERPTDVIRR
jgi:hypothetical protein